MEKLKRNFDQDAATWDDSARRLKLAGDIAQALFAAVALKPDMRALDFGCGTGLLTLQVQPHVAHITAVDSSRGMLDKLTAKLEAGQITNVDARYIDLDKGDSLPGSFDLIFSSMTMHHIADVGALLKTFRAHATAGALLCIIDLDDEDGRFHPDNTGVFHYGFDRESLRQKFEEAGFSDVRSTLAAQVVKAVADGTMQTFPVFLMTGRALE